MRVEVWDHRLLQCLSVRSPGRRHRSPGPLLCKGGSSRPLVGLSSPASPSYLHRMYSSTSSSPQESGMYRVPVASLHLTGKDWGTLEKMGENFHSSTSASVTNLKKLKKSDLVIKMLGNLMVWIYKLALQDITYLTMSGSCNLSEAPFATTTMGIILIFCCLLRQAFRILIV